MEKEKTKKFKIRQELTIPLVLLALWIILAILNPTFFTVRNITNLLRQASILGIASVGVTFLLVTGQSDLSVGSVMGLGAMVSTYTMSIGVPVPVSIILALLASMLVGVINGNIIYTTKVPAFIATLGTMTAVRGVAQLITGGLIISGLPKSFTAFASGSFLGIPYLVWTMFIAVAIGQFVLHKTIYGRNLYAVGSNIEVARLSGINVSFHVKSVYVLASTMAGFAGILYASRLSQGLPTTGSGYELNAITAAVIGGTSFMGGEGTVIGTLFGAVLMTTIDNGGNLLRINQFVLNIITGVITVSAVVIDTLRRRKES
ncbi:MAG: ABC transporter permease [Lachnospiraceae bacterium]|nr:ABC transporter permease [Lachnospiraceae bacterium]